MNPLNQPNNNSMQVKNLGIAPVPMNTGKPQQSNVSPDGPAMQGTQDSDNIVLSEEGDRKVTHSESFCEIKESAVGGQYGTK